MKTVKLPSGERVPALGQGTWRMAENREARAEELATLRLGLDLGLTVIDTAEMYGNGKAEELVGEAIAGRRDDVYLVTKVLPSHASRAGTIAACEDSLRRLRTDYVNLYLLHWRGSIPLQQTLDAFVELIRTEKIVYWGVSNLDLADMEELVSLPGGSAVTTDQVLYNLARRGVEWNLLPWLRQKAIPLMAYSPLDHGRLLDHPGLARFARHHRMTIPQVAIAWLYANDDVITIPKVSRRDELKENLDALRHPLTEDQLAELDQLFPPPTGPTPLETI